MPFQERLAIESRRRHMQRVMAGAPARTGVTDVLVAVVADVQALRLKSAVKSFANAGNAFRAQGSTLLKGLTVTLW